MSDGAEHQFQRVAVDVGDRITQFDWEDGVGEAGRDREDPPLAAA